MIGGLRLWQARAQNRVRTEAVGFLTLMTLELRRYYGPRDPYFYNVSAVRLRGCEGTQDQVTGKVIIIKEWGFGCSIWAAYKKLAQYDLPPAAVLFLSKCAYLIPNPDSVPKPDHDCKTALTNSTSQP